MASRSDILKLYRHILKAAQRFPSVKRDAIIADIKQEFRDHRVRSSLREGARVAGNGARIGATCLCPTPRSHVATAHVPVPPHTPDAQTLTDPDKIRKEIAVALRSLEQLEAYSGMRRDADWEISLKGPLE